MIEYYIDGSTKESIIGAGIVKVNEYGFIDKRHFYVEHVNPTSNVAEGYSLEKAFEWIKNSDLNKTTLIDIYTDSQTLYQSMTYNDNNEFSRKDFFTKTDTNHYYQYLRNLYLELISKHSNTPIYHCFKTNKPRPVIKIFYKNEAKEPRLLQEAHSLSRKYIKEDSGMVLSFKGKRENNKWVIIKDNKEIVAQNKRPLLALSEALKQTKGNIKQIKLCPQLETIIKNTKKNNLIDESMKEAIKMIEKIGGC